MFSEVHKRAKKAGQPPGSAVYTGDKLQNEIIITAITFDAKHCEEKIGNKLEDVFASQPVDKNSWINVEGLHDTTVIKMLAEIFHLHPLTVEDILNVDHRPKIEEFPQYIFISLKQLLWQPKSNSFTIAQFSTVFGKNFVLTFQEQDTTLFDPIRKRIQSSTQQRLREQGPDYLAYRLIDAIVDDYFIVLEALGNQIEKNEEMIISSPTPQNSKTTYRIKRQLLLLRKSIWPMREIIGHLLNTEEELITSFTRVYIRDLYDHTVQAIDTVETFRDMLSSMLDMYISSITNRMNEVIKTLTIISTIFIPITFIASVYGMNFIYMPELRWRYSYPVVWGAMIVITILMLIYFKRKKWI